jgi:hypothetical protein
MTAKLMKLILAMVMMVSLNGSMAFAVERFKTDEMGESGQIASRSMTLEEMEKLSTSLENMANEVKRGNVTPEVQTSVAEILNHLSHMLGVLANPDDKITYSIIKRENKELEKEWNPWDEMVEH